jgi:hypothetical protein
MVFIDLVKQPSSCLQIAHMQGSYELRIISADNYKGIEVSKYVGCSSSELQPETIGWADDSSRDLLETRGTHGLHRAVLTSALAQHTQGYLDFGGVAET